MKIYFIANARMPTPKAHGIHIAKMCEALIEAGIRVTLVVPARGSGSIKNFYDLRVEVPAVRLPTLGLYNSGRLGYAVSSVLFVAGCMLYLWYQRLQGKSFVIYTVDIDTFAHALLPLCGRVVAEMHSPKRSTLLSRFFFKHAKIVATNELIATELKKTFNIEPVIEPNGVDESFFNLSGGGGGALYVGRFYKWKGLEILPATHTPITVLGGSRQEFEKVFGPAGELQFAEARPSEVPLWLAAADVLLLVGTSKNPDSNRYTTPMKMFEYLATGKPVVASATEALRSVIPESLVHYCPPDDAPALAAAIKEALYHPGDRQARIAFAREHTWAARAERIIGAYLP